jgi:hypothetical protein
VKLVPDRVIEGRLRQVRTLRTGLGRILAETSFAVGAHTEAERLADAIDQQLDAIEQAAIEHLVERMEGGPFASWDCYDFMRPFATVATGERVKDAAACPTCGGPLLSKTIGHYVDVDVQRRLDYCYHCGVQRDAPIDSSLAIVIVGQDHIPAGQAIELGVQLTNRSQIPTAGIVALRLGKSAANQPTTTPRDQRFHLQPGSVATAQFRIDLKTPPIPHAHFAKAVAIEQFELVYSARPIWIER